MTDAVERILNEAAAFLTDASSGFAGDIREVEQKEIFVATLTLSIMIDTIGRINSGDVPVEWNGYELRQWVADRAGRQTIPMDRRRAAKYRNDIAVHNL